MGKKLSPEEYEKVKRNIVKKLYSNNCFSKGHLLFERLQSGIPKDIAGFVQDVLEDLIREKIVVLYGKTKHGDAYQLNMEKMEEIEKIIFSRGV